MMYHNASGVEQRHSAMANATTMKWRYQAILLRQGFPALPVTKFYVVSQQRATKRLGNVNGTEQDRLALSSVGSITDAQLGAKNLPMTSTERVEKVAAIQPEVSRVFAAWIRSRHHTQDATGIIMVTSFWARSLVSVGEDAPTANSLLLQIHSFVSQVLGSSAVTLLSDL